MLCCGSSLAQQWEGVSNKPALSRFTVEADRFQCPWALGQESALGAKSPVVGWSAYGVEGVENGPSRAVSPNRSDGSGAAPAALGLDGSHRLVRDALRQGRRPKARFGFLSETCPSLLNGPGVCNLKPLQFADCVVHRLLQPTFYVTNGAGRVNVFVVRSLAPPSSAAGKVKPADLVPKGDQFCRFFFFNRCSRRCRHKGFRSRRGRVFP